MMYYAGIGSRRTPSHILDRMVWWGQRLASLGLILRSGAAPGADVAFESGCDLVGGEKEIFLPWKGFNGSRSQLYYIPQEVYEYSEPIFGSGWDYIKPSVKKLMARNAQQILGMNLDQPVLFVLCYTSDGCTTRRDRSKKTGGTGQAIAVASTNNIPVFNLANADDERRLLDFLLETLTYD